MTTTTRDLALQELFWDSFDAVLQIAEAWGAHAFHGESLSAEEYDGGFASILRLLRHALLQLSEPSPSMIVALRSIVESHSSLMTQHESPEDMDRYWRDSAAIVLRAAVTGFTPRLGAS